MGAAADALENLTGVRTNKAPDVVQKYDVSPDDTNPAANALRTIMGVAQPANFSERFDAVRDRPLEPYTPQKEDQKPGVFGRIRIGFENQQLGASQRANSNPEDYKLISGKTYQNDAGEVLYDDPVTGKLTRTDRNKHVMLTDPSDNKLKVYERSEKNSEGVLAAAGHMLGTGLATGAPIGRSYQAVVAPAEEVIGASSRLSASGAPVAVPRAIASDNPITQEVGAIVRNVPLANAPLTKAAETTLSQLGEKASEISGRYGSSSSTDAAGNTAKESIRDWVTKSSRANESKLYDKVDTLINPDTKGTMSSTQNIASAINAERDAAALGTSGAVKQVQAAIDRGGLTYDGVKKLRTTIGEQLDSGILPEGTSKAELKRIYGALTDDLKATVEASGNKPALDAFNRANTYSRLANERRESLAKIVGSHADAPAEAVFDKIKTMAGSSSRADISKLGQARKVMGAGDWNEVASTVVGRMGRDVEGNFSPRRFLTDYGKISPAGKNLLFRSGGKSSLADSLDDIATISSRFKELEKYANPSGTSRSTLGGLIAYTAGVEPLTIAANVLGGRVLASALASPAGASSVAKWARSNLLLAQTPTPARLAAFSTASKNLISNSGAQNVSVSDFLRALQSPAISHADENEVPGKPGK